MEETKNSMNEETGSGKKKRAKNTTKACNMNISKHMASKTSQSSQKNIMKTSKTKNSSNSFSLLQTTNT